MQRRRITQIDLLEVRLANEATRLRKEAQGTPHGVERERLMRRARQAETGSHISEWLSSPGLQPLQELRQFLCPTWTFHMAKTRSP